jgi:RimJ/RimL family protein N-acetyltransferase
MPLPTVTTALVTASVTAPILETERLILRPYRADDLPHYAALWAEENVTRYIGGKPNTEEESWLRLLRQAGHWPLLGFGYWIVEERSTGTLLGEAGLAEFHREIVPPIVGTPEAGWVFSSAAHGKGYATEAMRAIFDWSKAQLPHDRTVCLIHPENTASLRLAAKLGFLELRQTIFRGHPTVLLERG